MNGRDRGLGSTEYFEQPGMTRESTLWLVEQGIKVIGFDRKFEDMAREFRETGDGRMIWEAHFAGIEREYCQIEKPANLDKILRPTGFKVACFPIRFRAPAAAGVGPWRSSNVLGRGSFRSPSIVSELGGTGRPLLGSRLARIAPRRRPYRPGIWPLRKASTNSRWSSRAISE
jgi:hypothetical protein